MHYLNKIIFQVLESPGPAKPQRKSSAPPTRLEGWHKDECRSPSSAQSPQSPISQDQPKLSHSVSQPLSHSHSNQLTNGNKLSNTPPHKLLLETSFTCSPVTSPQQRPDLRVHALAHALSWELVSALEEQLISSGFPQGYQIGCPEIPSVNWTAHAPLASPETLSDSSSISSRLSIILRDVWNSNKTPSPPLSPVSEHKASIKSRSRSVKSSNTSNIAILNNSPKIVPKKTVAPLGQGYCFYIDAPTSEKSTTSVPIKAVPFSRTPEEPVGFSSSPPPQYITLSPIVPNHVDETENSSEGKEKISDAIRETLSELFRSIDKPPFVIDLDDDNNIEDIGSPVSMNRKGQSTDFLDCHSIEGFLDDGFKISEGSRRSSISLNRGQTISQELTTSQMSRDSGYAERGTSGRQSNGTLADGVDETKASVEELDISEVSIDCKSWGDAQQEYGRGNGPPNPPHYTYSGVSLEEHTEIQKSHIIDIFEHNSDYVINQKRSELLHPLDVATPLLHGLKPKRKAAETSL